MDATSTHGLEYDSQHERAGLPTVTAISDEKSTDFLDIWIADSGEGGLIPRSLMAVLDPAEELRSQAHKKPNDRRRYLMSRILLRKALSCSLGGDPREWLFVRGEKGKVSLAHRQGLPFVDFSISHSGRAVAVALTSSGRVGVDVERIDAGGASGFGDYAAHDTAFTKRELRYLESRPLAARWEHAIKIWTVKEAYAKLLAQGVHLDFASFEAIPSPWRINHLDGTPRDSSPTGLLGAPSKMIHIETHEFELGPESYHLALASQPRKESSVPFASVRILDLPMLEKKSTQNDFETAKIARGPVSISMMVR